MEEYSLPKEGKSLEENKIENQTEGLEDRRNILMFAGCLFLGVLFDYLFCWKMLGISYPLFVMAFYGVLIWSLRSLITFKLDFACFLTIPIIALSLTFCLFSNQFFRIINFICIPILIFLQTTLLAGKNKYEWYSFGLINDIAHSIFIKPFTAIFRPFMFLKRIPKTKEKSQKIENTKKVFIGLVIAIPLVLVIAFLLSSADQVFGNYFDNILNINWGLGFISEELLARLFVILLVTFCFFSYFWSLINAESKIDVKEAHSDTRSLDGIIAITILSVLNLLYLIFVSIQFAYLFGGINNVVVSGLTYSEYARRGFFEIVLVTLINLSILFIGFKFFNKEGNAVQKAIKVLNSLLIIFTGIMLYSAHFRMSLYEQAYGFTYLRILTHFFMVLILLCLLVSFYRVWREGFIVEKAYILIALVFYVVLNFVNFDVMIAKNNFERYQKTKQIDVSYIGRLSYDVIPWLVQLKEDNNRDVAIEAENCLYKMKKRLDKEITWQSFNFSEHRARLKLSGMNLNYRETNLERFNY